MNRTYLSKLLHLIGGVAITGVCALPVAQAHMHGSADYMKMRQAQFVDRYDSDGDERVSSIEFEQARRSRFDITDENQDGTVSEDEYVYEWEDRLDAQLEKDRAGEVKQTVVRFGALDKDDDGKMSWQEYNGSAQRIFARHDGNEDGRIDADDPAPKRRWGGKRSAKADDAQAKARAQARLVARANRMLRMPSTHTMDGLMTRYDSDGDGAITRAEFDATRERDFARTDEDGNRWVSEDEYVAEYEDRLDAQIAEYRAASVKQAGRRFGALDKDEDAQMTFAEYQASGHRMFTRWDSSADGYVSVADALPQPREQVAENDNNTDSRADNDGNASNGRANTEVSSGGGG